MRTRAGTRKAWRVSELCDTHGTDQPILRPRGDGALGLGCVVTHRATYIREELRSTERIAHHTRAQPPQRLAEVHGLGAVRTGRKLGSQPARHATLARGAKGWERLGREGTRRTVARPCPRNLVLRKIRP